MILPLMNLLKDMKSKNGNKGFLYHLLNKN